MTDFKFLSIRREGPVAHLTLNRPDVRNAFNEDVISELTAWAHAAAGDASLRAVVLSGAGKAFCAGADIAWMAKMVSYTHEENVRDASLAAAMFAALDALPVPLVGRVHGAALGGGAGLAAVCDVVVAERQALFGFTEVKLGILPSIISPFVVAKIGQSAARELFLTGMRFDATRAREIGLVHSVVATDELDARVEQYVDEFLTAGPEAIATAKALLRHVAGRLPQDVVGVTSDTIATRRVSAEGQEGLTAFLEKRAPGWNQRES